MKDDEDMIIDVREEHLHENYRIEAKIKEKVDKVKEEASSGAYQKPRAVFSGLVDDILKDPATKMGLGKILHCFLLDHVFTNTIFAGTAISHKSLARSLQRKRKSSFGDNKIPSSWKGLEDIPEQFTKSSTGEEFLIYNREVNSTTGERILGFSSPSLLDVLRNSSEASIDGTFDITKWTLFSQVREELYF